MSCFERLKKLESDVHSLEGKQEIFTDSSSLEIPKRQQTSAFFLSSTWAASPLDRTISQLREVLSPIVLACMQAPVDTAY